MAETYIIMRKFLDPDGRVFFSQEGEASFQTYSEAIAAARELTRADMQPTWIFVSACMVEAEVSINETRMLNK